MSQNNRRMPNTTINPKHGSKMIFEGLVEKHKEYQRIMEEILINFTNVFVFIDGVAIVTKETKEEHKKFETLVETAVNCNLKK